MDTTGPAGKTGAVADVLQPEAAGEGGGVFGVEALAIIADADAELFGVPGEADVDIGGGGVFQAVLETLLDDAEKDQLLFFLYFLLVAFGGDGDLEAAGLADALHFLVDGFADAEVADMAGVETLGETAEILQSTGDVRVDVLDKAVIDGLGVPDAAELNFSKA